jgi:hypothetical protein
MLRVDTVGSIGVLHGAWTDADAREFGRTRPQRLVAHGTPDIEFLRHIGPLRSLEIHHLPLEDISPIESQPALETLSVNAYFKRRVDLSGLRNLKSLALDWGPGASSLVNARKLEHLSIDRYPGSNLLPLEPLAKLRTLRLSGAARLVSLAGIEAMSELEELRLLALRRLSDLRPVAAVPTLQSLELSSCGLVRDVVPLASLARLHRLLINNCGDIESLTPIARLPLRSLFFWESTNVLDGRLDVLLHLDGLVETTFADRRHYSHSLHEIEAVLADRLRRSRGN